MKGVPLMALSPEFSVVNSSHLVFNPTLINADENTNKDEILARRYQSRNLFNKELVFEFTRDPGLLQQYYNIRARAYRDELGSADYPSTETEQDRSAHIMVVRMGNFCVGGARIHVKSPRKNELLPLEAGNFRLEEHFPQLRHKQMTYGQTGAIVLLPEFRSGEVSLEMFRRLHAKGVALNLDISFSFAPKYVIRLDRKNCSTIGLESKIYHDIPMPVYKHLENIKFYLLAIITKNSHIKNFADFEALKARKEAREEIFAN